MVNKSLLILKSSSGGLTAVEAFLRNRDWKVYSTTDIKEALTCIVEHKPQFVMISIDHPSKKASNLIKILPQSFPLCVMAFTEDNSASAYGLLTSNSYNYVIYPPVTGPAVERTVHKYLKDVQIRKIALHQARIEAENSWIPNSIGSFRRRFTPEQLESLEAATKKDSIILQGAKHVLDSVCRVTTGFIESMPIRHASNIACITIKSPRFSGYLVVASATDTCLDGAFMDSVRSRLFSFLKSNGEKIKESEKMDLQIKPVPFEDWALDCAEFLRKSLHEGKEVAMAFFPRTDAQLRLGFSNDEAMASISFDEVASDHAVPCNVYVYLPRNNKYVLYTPRGGVFCRAQRQRLQSQGISHLHILKDDLRDLEKYRAQNFLNEKIQEFQERYSLKEST